MDMSQLLFKIIPRRWRFANRIAAFIFGYFWLACPICGEAFAGFEWIPGHDLYITLGHGKGVCYKKSCAKKAGEYSQVKFESTW